jgi:hypothetical protein
MLFYKPVQKKVQESQNPEESMNAEQIELWGPLNLAKREADPVRAHDMIAQHSMSLLSPDIKKKLGEVTMLALREIERLGGNAVEAECSLNNLADNLFKFIVDAAVPEKVTDAKCPRGPI